MPLFVSLFARRGAEMAYLLDEDSSTTEHGGPIFYLATYTWTAF
jgi:hypothetical protein